MKIISRHMIFLIMLCIGLCGNAFAQANNDKSTLQSTASTANDMVITTKIKAQLAANPVTKSGLITVETNGSVVKLRGVLDSQVEAVTAIQIAQSTVGVKDVDTSTLYVKADSRPSSQPVQDAYLTAKVKGVLIKEKLINDSDISAIGIKVETKNGVVYLTGKAKSEEQRKKIEEAIRSVSGVTSVISNLEVEK